VKCARGYGPIAEETKNHPVKPLVLHCQARPYRDGNTRSDNTVGAQDAQVQVGDVHGAAPATAVSGFLAMELRSHAAQIGALCDKVAVAPVSAGDVVVHSEIVNGSRRHGLLSHIEVENSMGEPFAEGLEALLFKGADPQHHPVQIDLGLL